MFKEKLNNKMFSDINSIVDVEKAKEMMAKCEVDFYALTDKIEDKSKRASMIDFFNRAKEGKVTPEDAINQAKQWG